MVFAVTFQMADHTPVFVKDCNRGGRAAHIEFLSPELDKERCNSDESTSTW